MQYALLLPYFWWHSDISYILTCPCFQEGCHWAKWLLFSRIKGFEYDASFCNAHSIFPQNLVPESNLNVVDADDILQTVDDMAEGGGEMAALATLMYAPLPIQKCLCYGSVSRQCGASFQCTLENLRPAFQQFPTLWRTLVSACFGQDTYDYPLSPRSNKGYFFQYPFILSLHFMLKISSSV